MTEHSLLAKFRESSLSISLTAALILVASIVVIISSITIQSAYMWLAVGATAVLFLGFCSCTTCEKSSQFQFARRGSVHSDSISTISDGRDNFLEVAAPHNNPDYWITDLPPSYAVATSMPPTSPEYQQPPPYSSLVLDGNSGSVPASGTSDSNKPNDRDCDSVTITISSAITSNNNSGNANDSEVNQTANNNVSVC